MTIFAKRMTMSFVLALLMAVLISYGGTNKKALPWYTEEFGQQSTCAVFIQDIRIFLQNILPTTVDENYYSRIYSPLPIAFSANDERPF